MGPSSPSRPAWTNVDKALDNLKARGLLTPAALRSLPIEDLAVLIRPSVYFNSKALKVKAFVERLGDHYNDDLEAMFRQDVNPLRRELLSIYGIGEETADDILLYAAGKPIFVIDAYTRRIFGRLEVTPAEDKYIAYQALFMENLTHDSGVVQRVPRSAGPSRSGDVPKAGTPVREMLPAGPVPHRSAADCPAAGGRRPLIAYPRIKRGAKLRT